MDEPGTLPALALGDVGEVLTLQRAAFVTEVQAHQDLHIPALTQTLADLHAELGERCCHGWVVRAAGRLVGCVRVHVSGDAAELVRLVVAPDRHRMRKRTAASTPPTPAVQPQIARRREDRRDHDRF